MPVTDNYSLVLPTVGGDTNLWGGLLNTGVMTALDSILGATFPVAITSTDVTLTSDQFQNAVFALSGTLTGNRNLIVPLSPNSGTVACAGRFVVDNQTDGAFNVTVKTEAVGSTGVVVPQGYRSVVYSDGQDVFFADDQSKSSVTGYNGTPNGTETGTPGSVNTPASLRFDYTNGTLYACTAASTTWGGIAVGVIQPQGYLTLASSATSPILTADVIAGTTVYYTPYTGGFVPISNGSYFFLVPFSQLTLTLSASQAASNIYDVYAFMDGTTLRIGTGPSWVAGAGGSITAGSCARGTGVGGAAIERLKGLWVNTAAMTMTNGANTYNVSALCGTYLGTIFMDTTQGQVTCHRSYGQSRKFGVWNAYNRVPIMLKAGDNTANWALTNGNSLRPANNNTANSMTLFCGLAEEMYDINYVINMTGPGGTNLSAAFFGGIGYNATNARSGFISSTGIASNTNACVLSAAFVTSPALGIQVVTALENNNASGSTLNYFGTETNMLLATRYRG